MKTTLFKFCISGLAALPVLAQIAGAGSGVGSISLKHGAFITEQDLPGEFAVVLGKLGGRMMSAGNARTTLAGTLTDDDGTRGVQITVQAPGYLRFQDSGSSARVLTFDGAQFGSRNGKGGSQDERIKESLLAHLPDMVLLQMAAGGGFRRIGGRFRTDDGRTPGYTGPYWTVYAYSPPVRKSMAWGQALQQGMFVAIDEQNGLLAEVRVVDSPPGGARNVIQTRFNNWFQQSGQWYPGEIVRKENGKQVLKLVVQQAGTGPQSGASSDFEP